QGARGWSSRWNTWNKFDSQPVKLRIEALMSAKPYDPLDGIVMADSNALAEFSDRQAVPGVASNLRPSSEPGNMIYSAANENSDPRSAWTKAGRQFSPVLDLSGHQALGVWIYGDGRGEVLNFQLNSPQHVSHGIGEHYVVVDFCGWRYFELIEPEGERYAEYSWPYGSAYSIYRESVNYSQIESLNLWYNNIPHGKSVTCCLKPIKALPLVNAKLINPAITIGDGTIIFPTEIETGSYLEFYSMSDCKLYGPQGELISEVTPQSEAPILEEGDNQVKFACDVSPNVSGRANVTIISKDKPIQ
ncbi:hypothetical protein ACFL6S_35380, partial [Candidatus Poribacteria bacterium]